MSRPGDLPCAGLTVVELAPGVSDLGYGMASGLAGMLLGDLGAHVVRVADPQPIDRDCDWGHAWHRDKERLSVRDRARIDALLAEADVVLAIGARIETEGWSYEALARRRPGLVYARCRPGRGAAAGPNGDFALLVEAQAGFCSQLAGHRPGPIMVDTRTTGAGAAMIMTAGVLSLLATDRGGCVETSLYDGMLATVGTMIGRSERAPETIERYWRDGNSFPNFMFLCADGRRLQFWFGGKGMYEKVIETLGDEPSAQGYYADQMQGLLAARAERWRAILATAPRDEWMARLRAAGIPCEPVLDPGEALADPHCDATGLTVRRGNERMVAAPITVRPLEPAPSPPAPTLAGLRVVDFSAYLAGPLGAQVLADLGAEVIKVEPPRGEAMRDAAYAVAACQRGKRSLAIDIASPAARPVVERLLAGADVVLHNFRLGVAERLGIAAEDLARLNPHAVHCHASAFGSDGPRARMPGNDGLMQALTGLEAGLAGEGNPPIAATWIPIDIAGGWLGALGMLAGLLARRRQGCGQAVSTSLMGAGLLLQSGVFLRGGEVVRRTRLDRDQTGYGAGYRLYRCADEWLALVIPTPEAWTAMARWVPGMAAEYRPLRDGGDDGTEQSIAHTLAEAPVETWIGRLTACGALAQRVAELGRDGFRKGILDDPENRHLGRAVAYEAFDWGRLEQIGRLVRIRPDAPPATVPNLPAIGEHSDAILAELGFSEAEIADLRAAGVLAA